MASDQNVREVNRAKKLLDLASKFISQLLSGNYEIQNPDNQITNKNESD